MLRSHRPTLFSGVRVPRRFTVTFNILRPMLLFGLLAAALGPLSAPVAAADTDAPTMEARVLLAGHARVGSWMAIEVRLTNDGPSVVGELRLAGGSESRTRFGTPVDLPTGSDKLYLLYAQPPGFGREIEIELVEGDEEIAAVKAPFAVRESGQLVVAIVAEQPQGILAGLDLMPNQQQQAPVTLALSPADLPSRVEAWGAIDRLIWQDVDSNRLEPAQLDALRGWLAGGGRMVIAGGTAGAATLSAFPDTLLPYRPLVTTDAAPSSLAALLGEIPETATDVPALSGELLGGRALASVGDQVIAAERAYGSGLVTVIGFNPATRWIGETEAGEGLWRRLLPPRVSNGLVITDDNQLISAVSQLPALALPPIGGLLALLGAYILLIGPVNYLVLRRLDRREWAWVTMPLLIVVFAVGAYGFGAALRGSNVIINEVAIVRGAPGATDGTAQVYLGVFSPSRETYQLNVPGGALLSAPLAGDVFGAEAGGTSLDVLQGEPARVRNLAVGFGSLRAIRAETATTVPLVEADLELVDGRIKGTIRNASEERLEKPAVVLGSTVTVLKDLEPGQSATVDVELAQNVFGQGISDKVVGSVFFPDSGRQNEEVIRQYVRHTIIDQLTYDPMFGSSNTLPSDGPVILAWGTRDILDVEISGQAPRRTGNVLYYLPTNLSISGRVAFGQDLLRSSVVETDAAFFSKDPWSMNFGRGTATLAYRPIPFEGTFEATQVVFNMGFGGDVGIGAPAPKPVEPLESIPPSCDPALQNDCPEPEPAEFNGLPEIEVFDRTGEGEWRRLPRLDPGFRYELENPGNYVEPATGTVLIRFVNDNQEGVGFSFGVELTGDVQ
jgi:hypothetical protein